MIETDPITFLTWKWKAPSGARSFQSKHVNVVYAMVARWYQRPFRFVCLTDEAKGLDERIEARPLPVRFDQLANPLGPRFPNCYCRLWTFSREAAELGERIFQLDIDVMITGDLCPLVDRDEDFVGWTDKRFGWEKIAGGAFLLRTGALPDVWEDFDPASSPCRAAAAGFQGSDQGWMSYKLSNGNAQSKSIGAWSGEGLIKINWTSRDSYSPPVGARMIFTSGAKPPWDKSLRREYPWVRKVWRNQ
jgi:hypothetical protein